MLICQASAYVSACCFCFADLGFEQDYFTRLLQELRLATKGTRNIIYPELIDCIGVFQGKAVLPVYNVAKVGEAACLVCCVDFLVDVGMVPIRSWPDDDKQRFAVVHRLPVIRKLKRYEHSYVTRGFPVDKHYVTLAGLGIAVAKVSMKKFFDVVPFGERHVVMAIFEACRLVAEASSGGQADMQAVQLGSEFLAETKACPKPMSGVLLPVSVVTATALREGAHEERKLLDALVGEYVKLCKDRLFNCMGLREFRQFVEDKHVLAFELWSILKSGYLTATSWTPRAASAIASLDHRFLLNNSSGPE